MNHTITPAELETIINVHSRKGARPASLNLRCPVKLLKKSRLDKSPCTLGEVVKITEQSVLVNFDYAGNVNRQREREGVEGEFKAKANWFFHVTPAIVEHNTSGERYAFVRVLRNLEAPAFSYADGQPVDREHVVAFLPADDLTDSERAAAGLPVAPANEHQGIEAEIQPIAVKLANVVRVTVDGTEYHITREITPPRITRTTPAPAAVPADSEDRFAVHN